MELSYFIGIGSVFLFAKYLLYSASAKVEELLINGLI